MEAGDDELASYVYNIREWARTLVRRGRLINDFLNINGGFSCPPPVSNSANGEDKTPVRTCESGPKDNSGYAQHGEETKQVTGSHGGQAERRRCADCARKRS